MAKKMTNCEVLNAVESEGLGYAVTAYMSAGRIKDEELAEAWANAEVAMANLQRLLDEVECGQTADSNDATDNN